MKITAVKINGMPHPMGYAFSNVTASWRVEDAMSARQKESTVRIALDADMCEVICEKTGRLPSAGVAMDVALKPRTTYYVQISVTGERGDGAVSETTSFDTGKMEEPWEAKWIGTSLDCDFHPLLATAFAAKRNVRRARLYITGVGL